MNGKNDDHDRDERGHDDHGHNRDHYHQSAQHPTLHQIWGRGALPALLGIGAAGDTDYHSPQYWRSMASTWEQPSTYVTIMGNCPLIIRRATVYPRQYNTLQMSLSERRADRVNTSIATASNLQECELDCTSGKTVHLYIALSDILEDTMAPDGNVEVEQNVDVDAMEMEIVAFWTSLAAVLAFSKSSTPSPTAIAADTTTAGNAGYVADGDDDFTKLWSSPQHAHQGRSVLD
ncbi:hypothetical protein BJV78DRAFT_1363005 [Lactifluus subvellereus]|nr:hypothetical protein BJV78DRAFT_1363005 [Lactifluus subvellereus]